MTKTAGPHASIDSKTLEMDLIHASATEDSDVQVCLTV